jgi:hypothetical protein
MGTGIGDGWSGSRGDGGRGGRRSGGGGQGARKSGRTEVRGDGGRGIRKSEGAGMGTGIGDRGFGSQGAEVGALAPTQGTFREGF